MTHLTDIDDCEIVLCENGATCFDLVNGHFCLCNEGYEGEFCETGEIIGLIVNL